MAMPQQENMFMYLASVDSSHLFSDNNPSTFRTKLPQPLYFENPSEWEIALKAYIGPTLHANLEEGTSFYLIHHQNRYYRVFILKRSITLIQDYFQKSLKGHAKIIYFEKVQQINNYQK